MFEPLTVAMNVVKNVFYVKRHHHFALFIIRFQAQIFQLSLALTFCPINPWFPGNPGIP